jgi:hypothetical protein
METCLAELGYLRSWESGWFRRRHHLLGPGRAVEPAETLTIACTGRFVNLIGVSRRMLPVVGAADPDPADGIPAQ